MLDQLQKSLNSVSDLDSHLLSRGYCIVEDVFDHEILLEIRDEIILLDECCKLESSPNSLQGREGEELILTKPGIFEWSLVLRSEKVAGEGTMSMVPRLKSLWEDRSKLVSILQSSGEVLSTLTDLDQLKVAVIREGGAFAVHTDTLPSTGRTLSATIYLNENYRQGIDGGELRILPFPYSPVDIAPTFGRMVLFSSCNLFHRVLPSHMEQRYCLSLMFYGSDPTFPRPQAVSGLSAAMSASLLADCRALTPLAYQDEFERSIQEAFETPDQHNAVCSAVERFVRTCNDARQRLQPALLEVLKSIPLPGEQSDRNR